MVCLVGKVNEMQVVAMKAKMTRKPQPNPVQQKLAALGQHHLVAVVSPKHPLVADYLTRMMMICSLWLPPKSLSLRKVTLHTVIPPNKRPWAEA